MPFTDVSGDPKRCQQNQRLGHEGHPWNDLVMPGQRCQRCGKRLQWRDTPEWAARIDRAMGRHSRRWQDYQRR